MITETADAEKIKKLRGILANLSDARQKNKLGHYMPYEFQKNFHNARGYQTEVPAVQRVLLAGNGTGKCVSYDTLITHPDGSQTKAGKLFEQGNVFPVLSWDGKQLVEAKAVFGVIKPSEAIYRIYLASGQVFECASNHRILLTSGAYSFVGPLLKSVPCLPASISGICRLVHAASAPRCFQRLRDFLVGYLQVFRSCGEQPRMEVGSVPRWIPLRGDVQLQRDALLHEDDPAYTHTSSHQPFGVHPSRIDALRQSESRVTGFLVRALSNIVQLAKSSIQVFQRLSIAGVSGPQLTLGGDQHPSGIFPALLSPFSEGNNIIAYSVVAAQPIYDFTVPGYNNYLAAGVIHHNTVSGAMEVAIHATGRYPEWWEGHKFNKPVVAMIGGMTNEAVRDICQRLLLGDPAEPAKLGTGAIPLDAIGKCISKPGVPNAYDTVLVKHSSGGYSKLMFRAYEQGKNKHMGHRIHLGWCDEEPPQDIWSQYLRATISMDGILFITFTPEHGLTEVVNQFMNNIAKGQALVQASWFDAPHLVGKDGALSDTAKQLLAGFPPHEREMRMRGTPTFGAGLVFPFSEESLVVDPIEIPRHWPQIIGIDFGFDHPFAAAKLAWDRDADIVYVTADYRESRATPAIHASAVKPWGNWPVSWPHDGINAEKGTGEQLKDKYIEEGLNLLPWKATNPPQAGQDEGEGGNSVEASILAMYERMESGRWKVFRTCRTWLEEQRIYHRDEKARLVKLRDDVISASRYAHMMLRHSRTELVRRRKVAYSAGVTNW